jgi:hypothetical protein
MTSWGLTEDQAITLLTVGCDFNVHQVSDEVLRASCSSTEDERSSVHNNVCVDCHLL